MKEDYLDDLYSWIISQDNTYSNRYSPEEFKTKMQDNSYSSKMYDWINSIDNTFADKYNPDEFQDKVKKKKKLLHLLQNKKIPVLHWLQKSKNWISLRFL